MRVIYFTIYQWSDGWHSSEALPSDFGGIEGCDVHLMDLEVCCVQVRFGIM